MFLVILLYLSIILFLVYYILLYSIKHYVIIKRYLSHKINRWRAIKWKKKNIKESVDIEKDYSINFSIIINDKDGNYKVNGDFQINIPATAPFFARKKLEKYIKENINIQINDINELRIP